MANTETQAGPSAQTTTTEPHQMRITDHGKIKYFVSFALKFLQENPQRPLVLHTFPTAKEKHDPNDNADDTPVVEPPKKKRKLAATTATIPRLITVVEIVKREYAKLAAARKTTDGVLVEDSLRTGLHQYNELSCLEDLGLADLQAQDTNAEEELQMALDGKNFLQQKFTAHLKVTLSVGALSGLEEKGATYQPPAPPQKISKSAKARQRKRRRKNEAEGMAAD